MVGILFEDNETAIVVVDHEDTFSQESIMLKSSNFTQFLLDTVKDEDE